MDSRQTDNITTENLKRKIKLCNVISIAFIILAIVLIVLEYLLAEFFSNQSWVRPALRIMIYSFYVIPFGITVPLFVRANLKIKLDLERKRMHEESSDSESER